MRTTIPLLVVMFVAAVLPAALVTAQPEEGGPFGDGTVVVGQSGSSTANVDVALELSALAFPDGGVDTVLVGRDDVFADSLASGAAQADGPLLLVPQAGPVPGDVMAEIERLGASRALILGGEAAVSATVEEELTSDGLTVQRLSGPTRIETAVDVARSVVPTADTAILARATGVEGNATSAFADTLAAGGWAAQEGWPILLTQSDQLTGSTRDYLAASSITSVNVMGGTAAIAEAVVDALEGMGLTVQRVAGPDRASTALEVAKARGADTAADAESVVLVDGFSDDAWAAGFGAAALSAQQDAPVVLGNVESLPPATEDWLVEGPQNLTCAVTLEVCEEARLEMGRSPALQVPVPPGTVTFTVANNESSLLWTAQFDGSGAGLGLACHDPYCTIIDWQARGERAVLAVQRPGVDDDGVYQLSGQTLEVVGGSPTGRNYSDDTHGMDAGDNRADGANSYVSFNDGFLLQDAIGGAAQSGAGPGSAIQASFQGRNHHPAMADADVDPRRSGTLYLTGGQELVMDLPRLTAEQTPAGPQIQRRPGAQVIGAAWAPNASGDIAMTDQVGGVGLLRVAPWPDGTIVQIDGIDANSAPYWLPDSATVVVLADTADGVSLVAADAVTGDAEVLVADAGDASGARISSDGSGTLIAWRAGNEIRVLNTADGSVAVLPPPAGYDVVGGPAFRP